MPSLPHIYVTDIRLHLLPYLQNPTGCYCECIYPNHTRQSVGKALTAITLNILMIYLAINGFKLISNMYNVT